MTAAVSKGETNDSNHVTVAIVGNGPSALAASSLLSGFWPFYDFEANPHPHDALHKALMKELGRVKSTPSSPPRGAGEKFDSVVSSSDFPSILELDLREALDIVSQPSFPKRTHSPWAILVDTLLHPSADGPSGRKPDFTCLQWKKVTDERKIIKHAIVGPAGQGGGSWNQMSQYTTTLSPGYWMELGGGFLLSQSRAVQEVNEEKSRGGGTPVDLDGRIPRDLCADYYKEYEERFILSPEVQSSCVPVDGHVTSLKIVTDDQSGEEDASDERTEKTTTTKKKKKRWLLEYQTTGSVAAGEHRAEATAATTQQQGKETKQITADVTILAGGMYSKPKRLPNCQFLNKGDGQKPTIEVFHRSPHSWAFGGSPAPVPPRVVVVGAGLSASDAVIAALRSGWHVYHVFRSTADKTKIVDKFGHMSSMYADYYALSLLMRKVDSKERATAARHLKHCETFLFSNAAVDHYVPHSLSNLVEVHADDGTCVLEEKQESTHSRRKILQGIDRVVILVGSTPDFSFFHPSSNDSGGSTTEEETGDVLSLRFGLGDTPIEDPLNAMPNHAPPPTHPVFVNVDPYTNECHPPLEGAPLFAFGPLRGDNFCRFVVGDAWPLVQKFNGFGGDSQKEDTGCASESSSSCSVGDM